jgi:FAD:protein FMN transferase
MSGTVITENVMDADALSKAVFVLGSKKGIALIDALKDTSGLIINIEGETRVSRNMNSIKDFTLKSFKNSIRH